MKVAIRADGGPAIGYGHLVRTAALATELLERNHSVLYFTTTPQSIREVCPSAVEVIELSTADDGAECARELRSEKIHAVVTDSYHVVSQYQQELSESVETVAVFQASDEYTLNCDILINSHLFALELEYDYVGPEPLWCLGVDYCLLREEFNQFAQNEPRWRETAAKALIIMGGSDVNNITPEAMRAFDGCNLSVDVIIGPGYTNHEEIERTAETVNCNFSLHNNPSNLAELMFEADFAVSALGTTVYELLATNTPIVGISQAENQKRIARMIHQRDLGIIVDSKTDIREGVKQYTTESRTRWKVFHKYQGLIDGNGPKRVADSIENQILSV